MKTAVGSVLCCAAWVGLCAAAHAATASDSFQVTATVVTSCEVTATDLGFGAYDPVVATPLDASTTIEVRCTNGAGYVIALGAGIGSGATTASRRMTAGGDTLVYSLYQNAGRTTLWGDNAGVDTVAGTGSGAAQVLTIYGRAPARQTSPAGAYADTITVTLTY